MANTQKLEANKKLLLEKVKAYSKKFTNIEVCPDTTESCAPQLIVYTGQLFPDEIQALNSIGRSLDFFMSICGRSMGGLSIEFYIHN